MADNPAKDRGPARTWSPRMWQGCDFFGWMRLLVRNRFAVAPSCVYIAVIVTVVSVFHSVLRILQGALYGDRIRRVRLPAAPIFIIGHWRTGTTFLHELLTLDERHTSPNYYQCLEPNHFLLTEGLITRWLSFLMPSRRPMDNMAAGWNRPQEDEFALCMMGLPSPYLTIAFPNHPPQYPEYLDLRGLTASDLSRWKRGVLTFLKQLTFKDPRRLVLKSPTHSCRIEVFLEMFPDARFVHIVRDPYVVFPSTVNLWKSLYRTHALQTPTFAGLEDQVYSTYTRLYDALERGRKSIPAGHYHELKYEDLIKNPVGEMETLYARLGLGGYAEFRPKLEAYLQSVAGYETNKYQVTGEQRETIGRRWAAVFERYGYERS